ncbi:hypothetical protein FRC12_011222 [Ceratobasidium sp. 428]|nr:hypothetical protein FRC09_015943 [Ceratobasidium sp. 395]KAG8790717.1 hypothetical protein FRC12_011222 [Ceratobasidium sp. 428]
MSAASILVQLATTTFTTFEKVFAHNFHELLYKLLEYAFLLLVFHGSSLFTTKQSNATPKVKPTIPRRKRLPMLIRYMSEARKSVLRATYARDVTLFRPGSAQLPLAQRFLAAPITLSGPDGSINVALRPLASQINLGHEYSPEPTPCSTPQLSMYVNSQAEVRATLAGATEVLNALVRGAVDEKWLSAPGDEIKPLTAPLMIRSYAKFGDEGTKMGSRDSEWSGVRTPTGSKDKRAHRMK